MEQKKKEIFTPQSPRRLRLKIIIALICLLMLPLVGLVLGAIMGGMTLGILGGTALGLALCFAMTYDLEKSWFHSIGGTLSGAALASMISSFSGMGAVYWPIPLMGAAWGLGLSWVLPTANSLG